MLEKIRSRTLVWDTITTTLWSTLGKAVGFLIPFFLAAWFGVSAETDAFFFAYALILFLAEIFSIVVERVIVPYIAELRAKDGDVGIFVGRIMTVSGIGLGCLAAVFLLLVRPLLPVITDFGAAKIGLISKLLLEFSPLVVLLVWTSILAGTMNAHKRFAIPAVSPVFRALINLLVIYLMKDIWGVHAIVFGYLAGEVVRFGVLLGVIQKTGVCRVRLDLHLDDRMRNFIRTASYQVFGMVAVGMNPLVDKTMASWLGEGSVSILYYADRLYMIPVSFIISGLMVTLLSHWSGKFYTNMDAARLRKDVGKAVGFIICLTLAMLIVLAAASRPLVWLAFGGGAFDVAILDEVRWVWICYLLGFAPQMVGRIYIQAHLTLKNTIDLMRSGIMVCFLNVVLNYLFMGPWGVQGIALATTLTSICSMTFLTIRFYRKTARS